MTQPTVVDFETEAIQGRPNYPPKPVGVAIWIPGKEPVYLAWGHPEKNNCTKEHAGEILKELWASHTLLFHNAKFDLEVAEKHFGLALPPWHRVHDTMFKLFLRDPHASTLSLKPSAERILGLAPKERDEVFEWLVAHGIVLRSQKNWGGHICDAPGDVVGLYAVGDVVRTRALHEHILLDEQETAAYERELKLLPILLKNEQTGMRVDIERMEKELLEYEKALEVANVWLREQLCAPSLNFDSKNDVAAALDKAGLVTEWTYTKTGRKSVSKKNLTTDKIGNPEVAKIFGYRNRLQTALSMSMRPWLLMARENNGYIYTSWNQVKQGDGTEQKGTRTGRLSCSYFQNITKDWYDKGDGYVYPAELGVPDLPLVRKYILPDVGGAFCHRDYNQQEFRILAHFEDDKLCHAYRETPRLDFHSFMQAELKSIAGLQLARRPVKILNFGLLYGMGVGKLAASTGIDVASAQRVKQAQRAALPGLRALEIELRRRGQCGESLSTWGGRTYYCEPPRVINDQLRTFEYKLLNYLVQGSAADCTKEAVIRYNDARKDGRFLVTVHDEINISVPQGAERSEMKILNDVMASVEFDVPMISDGKTGPSWGELTKYEE